MWLYLIPKITFCPVFQNKPYLSDRAVKIKPSHTRHGRIESTVGVITNTFNKIPFVLNSACFGSWCRTVTFRENHAKSRDPRAGSEWRHCRTPPTVVRIKLHHVRKTGHRHTWKTNKYIISSSLSSSC